ncbi:MAG: penicillin-binding protein 2 [Bacteroidales bacterium]|jgi:penicillin-binding protein 2|nr:penicillin-binding protein 2 [Bacteroidales bacterium]
MNQYDIRKYVIGGTIILVALILIIRLFFLQVIDVSYKISADNNSQRLQTQYPARGLILDRNGRQIVNNQAAYDLMVTPRHVKPFDTTELAKILGLTVPELKETFARLKKDRGYSSYRPSLFLKQMSAETYAVLQEHLYKFPGFFVQARTLRNYVLPIAPHLLGYVAEVDSSEIKQDGYYKIGDYIGKTGIEKYYEKELRGKKGVNIYLVDVHNRIVNSFRNGDMDTMAVVGNDLTITIDAELQVYAEKLMSKVRGAVVAIEPSTGEILAMVSVPNYDPSLLVGRIRSENYRKLNNAPSKPLFDRSVMAFYPPGSTFKVAQGLVGLQQGSLTPSTLFGCHGGYYVGRFSQRCHYHGSPLNLPQAIGNSCNTYFALVFRNFLDNQSAGTTRENYMEWRKDILSFGFGQKLGIDLPQELAGNVPPVEYYDKKYFPTATSWRSLTIVSLSIGQAEMGNTVVQMANFAALIANGGYYHVPHLIKKINGRDTIPQKYAEKRYTVVDTSHFRPIREGMFLAVTGPGGTARSVAIPGIDMCGKTGTAENPHGDTHATFMAFAPMDKPKIAIAVYVENVGYGGTWAAPVASLMIEKYLTGSTTRPWLEDRMLNFNKYDNREAAN